MDHDDDQQEITETTDGVDQTPVDDHTPSEGEPEPDAVDGERADDGEREASDGRPSPPRKIGLQSVNATIPGMLTLHLERRDVHVTLDGDAALRMLKMFELRDARAFADEMHPMLSSARVGWVVVDLDDVRAMSWTPDDPMSRRRTIVDPAPAAA